MEPSNSLKNKAIEEIRKGSSSFQFGNVVYILGDILPDNNVLNFFVAEVEKKIISHTCYVEKQLVFEDFSNTSFLYIYLKVFKKKSTTLVVLFFFKK